MTFENYHFFILAVFSLTRVLVDPSSDGRICFEMSHLYVLLVSFTCVEEWRIEFLWPKAVVEIRNQTRITFRYNLIKQLNET